MARSQRLVAPPDFNEIDSSFLPVGERLPVKPTDAHLLSEFAGGAPRIIPHASKNHKCRLCHGTLNLYNRTGICNSCQNKR